MTPALSLSSVQPQAGRPTSLFPSLAGSSQEDELGHEEDVLAVEGPGAGGDQYRRPLQLPGR